MAKWAVRVRKQAKNINSGCTVLQQYMGSGDKEILFSSAAATFLNTFSLFKLILRMLIG